MVFIVPCLRFRDPFSVRNQLSLEAITLYRTLRLSSGRSGPFQRRGIRSPGKRSHAPTESWIGDSLGVFCDARHATKGNGERTAIGRVFDEPGVSWVEMVSEGYATVSEVDSGSPVYQYQQTTPTVTAI